MYVLGCLLGTQNWDGNLKALSKRLGNKKVNKSEQERGDIDLVMLETRWIVVVVDVDVLFCFVFVFFFSRLS